MIQTQLQQKFIENMIVLQEGAAAESKLFKPLIVLATLYLPLNLIVICVSAPLVSRESRCLRHTSAPIWFKSWIRVTATPQLRIWLHQDTWLLVAIFAPLAF